MPAMSADTTPRWVQRFASYQKALAPLSAAVKLASERALSDLEKLGVVRRFGCAQYFAWLAIRDFYQSTGNPVDKIRGELDAFRLATQRGLVGGETLTQSIGACAQVHRSYGEEGLDRALHNIVSRYHSALVELEISLLKEKQQQGL